MKKFTFLVLACLPILLFAQERRIMVLTDPHVLAPELMDVNSQSFQDMIKGQRKMINLSVEAFDALLDTAIARQIDVLLIPGDLTKDSEVASHTYVRNKLRDLTTNHGIQVYVIPGNHDIGGKAKAYVGESAVRVDSITNEQWDAMYFDNLMQPCSNNTIVKHPSSHSFAAEPFAGLTILGIDGSDNDAGTGTVDSKSTLSFITAQADAARQKGHMIIAMSHWQVLEHFDQQGTLVSAGRFSNADEVRDALMKSGVHVLLTGHFHVNGMTTYKDSTGVVPDSLVEITTGAPITYPCPFRILTVSGDCSNLRVETGVINELESVKKKGLIFADYSREWMKEHTQNMIPTLTLRAFAKAEPMVDSKGLEYLTKAGLEENTAKMIIGYLKTCIPQTDEAKIDLVQRHLGDAIVDLYILHSDANEPQDPTAQDKANAVYAGLNSMMVEIICNSSVLKMWYQMGSEELNSIIAAPQIMASPVVQSLVEDKTFRSSTLFSDVTDDLRLRLVLNAPFQGNPSGIEMNEEPVQAVKLLRDGQVIIYRQGHYYTPLGVMMQ